MAIKIDFWQIIYKPEQESQCYPFAKTYFNESLTEFFENSVISKLVMESEADKIAVCSWKLKQKMRWNVRMPRPLTEEVLKTEFQVMSFTGNTKYHQFLGAANAWHPGILDILKKILVHIGDSMPSEIKNPIYQNHFCATREIYQRYVLDYLVPAMAFMRLDPELKDMCWKDSNYSNLNKTDSASPEFLRAQIGVPYYPLHPFILERLFPIFCHIKKIPVTYL